MVCIPLHIEKRTGTTGSEQVVNIGRFDSAVDAAVAFAKFMEEEEDEEDNDDKDEEELVAAQVKADVEAEEEEEGEVEVVEEEEEEEMDVDNLPTEAKGWKLQLSARTNTGYKGVYFLQTRRLTNAFEAKCFGKHLGHYANSVDAAVAYAKAFAGADATEGSLLAGAAGTPCVVEVAEGLRLHMAMRKNVSTPYLGVSFDAKNAHAPHPYAVKCLGKSLGSFKTAIEAAVAYAKHAGEAPETTVPRKSQGYQLLLNPKSATGYQRVHYKPHCSRCRPFQASDINGKHIGSFPTAEEAAVAVAKAVAAPQVSTVDDSTLCKSCGGGESRTGNEILLCDGCDAGYHIGCLSPPLTAVPKGSWFCPACDQGDEAEAAAAKAAEAEAEGGVDAAASSGVITHAEGFSLYLSKQNAASGYMGVRPLSKTPTVGTRYKAYAHDDDRRQIVLGIFSTAVEAAVAYAKFQAQCGSGVIDASADRGEDEGMAEEGGVEEEEEREEEDLSLIHI